MSVAKKVTIAAVAAAALVGVAVIADDMKDGAMTMIAPSGKMSTMMNANMAGMFEQLADEDDDEIDEEIDW